MGRVIGTCVVVVGCWASLAVGGCAAVPVQRATGVDLSGGRGTESQAGLGQHAVGIGNVSTESPAPMVGVTGAWPADTVGRTLLEGAVAVVLVVIVVRRLVSRGCKAGQGPPEGGAK